MFNESPSSGFRRRWRPIYLLYALLAVGGFLAMGLVVQWLWNAILPQVAGAGHLGYWQALGLLALSRILFGGWRGRRHYRGGPSQHLRAKWRHMSDEEREQFKTAWRDRCRRRDAGEK